LGNSLILALKSKVVYICAVEEIRNSIHKVTDKDGIMTSITYMFLLFLKVWVKKE